LTGATATTTHEAFFADLVARRRAVGLERHAPDYLTGPPLLEPLALEAIDAFNYFGMELERLAQQHPFAEHVNASVARLHFAAGRYAAVCAQLLARTGGPQLDVEATAYERMHGPAAHEYGYFNSLTRDNALEAVEEYADAHILAGFELDRRDLAVLGPEELLIARARDIAGALAVAALEVRDDVLAHAPWPAS
jgi:hypothetical protein